MVRKTSLVSLALLALGGCASFSPDGGFTDVGRAVQQRTGGEARWLRSDAETEAVATRVRQLLAEPLGPEQAVQIALFNNRGLQAAYAELGISESELVQAGPWINPGFSFARLQRGDELEIERKFIFDLLALFTMPRRTEIAQKRFEQAKLRAAGDALQVAADARRAWFEAVAAEQSARYASKVRDSAEAGAELAERMARAGNFSALDRMREQAFNGDAGAQLARARQGGCAHRSEIAPHCILKGRLKPLARIIQDSTLRGDNLRERSNARSDHRQAKPESSHENTRT